MDTGEFSALSTRRASSYNAMMSGVTLKIIRETAHWSSARTFKRFTAEQVKTWRFRLHRTMVLHGA